MYIGPWQEYSLSKARTTVGVNDQLRPSIEEALLSTLDPEAAQKALEAMKPYFERQRAPQHPRQGRNGHHHAGRRRMARELPVLHSSINSPIAVSARERNLQAASPLSVRSTKSEPIRYSYAHHPVMPPGTPQGSQNLRQVFQTQTFQEISDSGPPQSTQDRMDAQKPSVPTQTPPSYDAAAAVNFLRLERNARARTEIAKLTGWKLNTTLGSVGLGAHINSSGTGVASVPAKRPPAGPKDSKIEQLNALKQQFLDSMASAESQQSTGLKLPPLHKNGGAALTMSNMALHNSQSTISTETVKFPPMQGSGGTEAKGNGTDEESGVVPHTPRIGDLELTDEAFSLVSKYFQQNTNDTAPGSYIGSSNYSGGTRDTVDIGALSLAPRPAAKALPRMVARRDGALTPLTDDIESEANSFMGSGYAGDGASSPVPHPSEHLSHARGAVMATMEKSDYDDEAPVAEDPYAGGIDGLLLWSKQLEAEYL